MSGKEFKVRRGRAADQGEILELERGCATAPHWAASVYAEILEEQGGIGRLRRCLFVAEMDRAVAGFAVGIMPVDGLGELESVAVAASARRMGAGRALCVEVIDWCRTQGAVGIVFEVRAGSAGAIAMYEGLGFVEAGRRVGYYRGPEEDAVVMRLEL